MSIVENRDWTSDDLELAFRLCVIHNKQVLGEGRMVTKHIAPARQVEVAVDDNESNDPEDYRTWYPVTDGHGRFYITESGGDAYWILEEQEFDFEE